MTILSNNDEWSGREIIFPPHNDFN
jgi:hypothetical protein